MLTDQDEQGWAREEFGLACLDNKKRVTRLVQMAATAANQPAGKVTEVFQTAKEREGAFRLLENDAVAPEEIQAAAHRACARRVAGEAFAFVPVDGTSLHFTDRLAQKGLGLVGPRCKGARGLQVMSALAVSPEGVPLGLCGQEYWTRVERSKGKKKKDRRPTEEKETRYWLWVMQQVRRVFKAEAPQTRPWFQLDRGGDAWPVLFDGLNSGDLFTVRAAHDRRVTLEGADEKRRYLWKTLETAPVLGVTELIVRARPERRTNRGVPIPAREAHKAQIELRAAPLSLQFCVDRRDKWVTSAPLYALLACETAESAEGNEPIEWMLLTSHPVTNAKEAHLVLFGYAQRWRIEEFHRCWKSGACKVEETQLRASDHILRWASVLASVAVRVLRITYLARHDPTLSSLIEFTTHEVDAIVLASKSTIYKAGSYPPIGIVVDMVARIGGYTGSASGGPPGPIVIIRGLFKIEGLADALEGGLVVPAKK